jgi:hypothetical protein
MGCQLVLVGHVERRYARNKIALGRFAGPQEQHENEARCKVLFCFLTYWLVVRLRAAETRREFLERKAALDTAIRARAQADGAAADGKKKAVVPPQEQGTDMTGGQVAPMDPSDTKTKSEGASTAEKPNQEEDKENGASTDNKSEPAVVASEDNDPPIAPAAHEDEDDIQCRICFGDEDVGRLISPCLCKGSMRFVHLDCLNQWRISAANATSYFQCDQCKYRYSIQVPPFLSLFNPC